MHYVKIDGHVFETTKADSHFEKLHPNVNIIRSKVIPIFKFKPFEKKGKYYFNFKMNNIYKKASL